MRLIKLKASNIKRVVAIEVEPNGRIVRITGRNGQGKSSYMDALYWLFAGVSEIQGVPVRLGETHGEIEGVLGEGSKPEIVVRRTFNTDEKGEKYTTGLSIESFDGQTVFKSPQTLLNSLVGEMALDPEEFMNQKPQELFDTLRKLVGVDFTRLNAERARHYEERTVLSRQQATLKVRVDSVPVPSDAPAEEIDTAPFVDGINEALKLKEKRQDADKECDRLDQAYQGLKGQANSIAFQIEDLDRRRKGLLAELMEIEGRELVIAEQQVMAESIRAAILIPDVKELQDQYAEAEKKNRLFRNAQVARKQAKDLADELNAVKKNIDERTRQIEVIDDAKAKLISEAKFPLPGLGFAGETVTYNGLPLDQASHSERLRVSMAVAMALNPKLRLIRIKDANGFDSESLKIIDEMCADKDFQCWMEITDESGKIGVFIEAGEVAAVDGVVSAAQESEAAS